MIVDLSQQIQADLSTVVVDLYPLYPAQLRPAFMVELRGWYIKTYRDQFFINPP